MYHLCLRESGREAISLLALVLNVLLCPEICKLKETFLDGGEGCSVTDVNLVAVVRFLF